VPAHGYSTGPRPYQNTFQLIASTDGVYSFIVYNYGPMEWPNNSVNKSVQVGFNSGGSGTYYTFANSFSTKINSVANTSNVDMPGRWIFRSDQQG